MKTTKPPARSRYDELHDKYHTILTTKAGTRYERLAALVFKALEDRSVVIHDMELTGEDPEVKHQIDVSLEVAGSTRRIIVECKDFDISDGKVGLAIVRNFRSVIEDTGADVGIVITCTGFTEDARKYARSKGIKLAVLRLFESKDMQGRVVKIMVGVTIQQPSNARASIHLSEAALLRFRSDLASMGLTERTRNTDPVYFVNGGERRLFNEFLTAQMNDAIEPAGPKALQIKVPSDGWLVQVAQNAPIPFDGIVVDFDVDEEQYAFEVVSNRVAELILTTFGTDDIIIFGDQIEGHAIDPDTGALI
ncbi:restriction endonuclease [Mesorhizobium sp. WSM4310]|uniref:restriction endonuclease n=1 Tax=Mesorhizobium sp. WSM4310 TaxID=2589883 RepID=UPI00163D7738|nr:restriction endonuclease [Mesorhizobium sp. WSM4310]